MMTCCVPTSNAQATRVVESLPDGSLIVEVAGIEYRALTAEQMRKIQAMKAELKLVSDENETLTASIAAANAKAAALSRSVELANENVSLNEKRADEFRRKFEGEQQLRLAAEKLISRPNALDRFLKNPAVQVAIVAVSIVAAVKTR